MTKRTWLGPAALLSAFGLLSACNTSATPAQPAPATASNGTRPAWASAGNMVGRVGSSDPISIQVHLQLKDLARAEAELAELSDPDSARYGQWLSDEEFAAKYGPSDEDVAAVKAHLAQYGIVVKYVPGNRTYIQAEGTAAQLEQAFSTKLGLFKVGDQVKRAPLADVVMPTALASRVSTVLGLSSPALYAPRAYKRGALSRAQAVAMVQAKNPHPYASGGPQACSEWYGQIKDTNDPAYPGYSALTYAPCGYKPAHIRSAYGFSDIIRKGNDGTGQKIAIVDAYLSPTLLQDAQTYAANNDPDYPLKAKQLVTLWGPGQTDPNGPDTGWYGEQTLDVEAAHAMAPGATLVAVAAQSPTDQDLIGAVNLVIDQRLGSVISNSYGMVEQGSYTDFLAWKAVFAQAGLKGIGIYFSSGDAGDNSQGFFGPQPPSADFPASSDLVTAVGGTSLALGQTGERDWELGWETGAAFLTAAQTTDAGVTPATWDPTSGAGYYIFGAGGGYSVIYEQPKWQQNVVPGSIATVANVPRRMVPDVGMLADPITGFLIGQSAPDGTNYSESTIGGTSLACPLFAATIAVAQQHAHRTFGFANPLLYKKQATAFRDIVPNGVPQAVALPLSDGSVAAVTFDYPSLTIKTGAGWDSVTGLGAPNGKAFIDAVK